MFFLFWVNIFDILSYGHATDICEKETHFSLYAEVRVYLSLTSNVRCVSFVTDEQVLDHQTTHFKWIYQQRKKLERIILQKGTSWDWISGTSNLLLELTETYAQLIFGHWIDWTILILNRSISHEISNMDFVFFHASTLVSNDLERQLLSEDAVHSRLGPT